MKLTKIIFSSFFIFLLIFMGGCLFFVENYYNLTTTLKNEISLTYKIQADVLMLRRHEKDFFARQNAGYVTKFESALHTIKKDLHQLDDNINNIPRSKNEVKMLSQQLDSYVARFDQIKDIQLNLGLTPEEGLYGNLRANAHQIEDYLSTLSEPSIVNALLSVRRSEKDFMLRTQSRDLEEWEESVAELKQVVIQSKLNTSHKDILIHHINGYTQNLNEYVKGMDKQGLINHHGMITDLSLLAHRFEQSLNALTQQLLELSSAAERTAHVYTQLLMLSFGLGILALCSMPFLLLKLSHRSEIRVKELNIK